MSMKNILLLEGLKTIDKTINFVLKIDIYEEHLNLFYKIFKNFRENLLYLYKSFYSDNNITFKVFKKQFDGFVGEISDIFIKNLIKNSLNIENRYFEKGIRFLTEKKMYSYFNFLKDKSIKNIDDLKKLLEWKNISFKNKTIFDDYRAYSDWATNYTDNIGTLVSFKKLGVEYYEIIAIIDSKTSKICRKMDGRVFKTGKIITEYENKIKDVIQKNMDFDRAIRYLHKFPSQKKLKGYVSSSNLKLKLPPFHPHCRTEIATFIKGDKVIDKIDFAFRNYEIPEKLTLHQAEKLINELKDKNFVGNIELHYKKHYNEIKKLIGRNFTEKEYFEILKKYFKYKYIISIFINKFFRGSELNHSIWFVLKKNDKYYRIFYNIRDDGFKSLHSFEKFNKYEKLESDMNNFIFNIFKKFTKKIDEGDVKRHKSSIENLIENGFKWNYEYYLMSREELEKKDEKDMILDLNLSWGSIPEIFVIFIKFKYNKYFKYFSKEKLNYLLKTLIDYVSKFLEHSGDNINSYYELVVKNSMDFSYKELLEYKKYWFMHLDDREYLKKYNFKKFFKKLLGKYYNEELIEPVFEIQKKL